MAARTRPLGLALGIAALWLVCASAETLASSQEAVQGPALTISVTASTAPPASDSSTACLDIATDGANITHIFVISGCAASPSEFAITVDGEEISELHTGEGTDEGPCEDIPRDVWFPLHASQNSAHVCVSVQG